MLCPIKTKDNSEILLDYCAKRLTPETAAAFENHMQSCADCRSFSEAQASAWAALDTWEPIQVSENFDAKLYARIEQHENSGWWNKLWHRTVGQPGFSGPAMPIATACVTMIIGVMLYMPFSKPSVEPQTPQIKIEST